MIHIAPYDPAWPAMFEAEAATLRQLLGDRALRVEHVGSTSVPGLAAKPVIDIQVSVATLEPRGLYVGPLASLGYRHLALGEFDLVYPFFQKPTEWPCSHHVHLCVRGSRQECDHLAFRDYLRRHAAVAAEYLALKRIWPFAITAPRTSHGNAIRWRSPTSSLRCSNGRWWRAIRGPATAEREPRAGPPSAKTPSRPYCSSPER
jgi:GrpB-like predicted nucleotidyltransferase (UPF0157 family)